MYVEIISTGQDGLFAAPFVQDQKKGGHCVEDSFKDYSDLPLMLNAKQVQQVLGVSRSATYKLMNSEIPSIRLGNRIVAPRAQFIAWINNKLDQ